MITDNLFRFKNFYFIKMNTYNNTYIFYDDDQSEPAKSLS